MKKSKKGTSVAEAIIVMFIVATGAAGMYDVFNESMDLSVATHNKIQAIQIAREGIEIVKNIRDTNMLLYAADPDNCWNVHNYDIDCVGDFTNPGIIGYTDIPSVDATNTSIVYYPFKGNDNRWYLQPTLFSLDPPPVKIDLNGLYTQSGGTNMPKPSPTYTRKITIAYPTPVIQNPNRMDVTSKVTWSDKNGKRNVTFSTTLTNWKQ